MALFKKKGEKTEKNSSKSGAKSVSSKTPKQPKTPKAPKQQRVPKQPRAYSPPDIYTLFLGLAALFFLAAAVLLGINYWWYTIEPAVIPMNWVR